MRNKTIHTIIILVALTIGANADNYKSVEIGGACHFAMEQVTKNALEAEKLRRAGLNYGVVIETAKLWLQDVIACHPDPKFVREEVIPYFKYWDLQYGK